MRARHGYSGGWGKKGVEGHAPVGRRGVGGFAGGHGLGIRRRGGRRGGGCAERDAVGAADQAVGLAHRVFQLGCACRGGGGAQAPHTLRGMHVWTAARRITLRLHVPALPYKLRAWGSGCAAPAARLQRPAASRARARHDQRATTQWAGRPGLRPHGCARGTQVLCSLIRWLHTHRREGGGNGWESSLCCSNRAQLDAS